MIESVAGRDFRSRLRTPPDTGLGRRGARVPELLGRRVASRWAHWRAAVRKKWAAQVLARRAGPLHLCLGSGGAPIEGWINVDRDARADLHLDVRFGLPLPDGCVNLVYSEHVLEHLTLDEGAALFRECRRVLAAGGVLRLASPDLDAIVAAFLGDQCDHGRVGTRAWALNQAFHGGGHRYLYDEAELTLRLREAGFDHVGRRRLAESSRPELAGLETRLDSTLILEASFDA